MPRTVPNFFIVGAQKSGTTTVSDILRNHPDVYMTPIKEPCYFATDIVQTDFARLYTKSNLNPDNYVKHHLGKISPPIAFIDKEETYYALYRGWSGQKAIGEASADYLPSLVAAEEIARVNPRARIVMILRNPVNRAYSEYLMNLRLGITHGSFRKALQYEAGILARNGIPDRERYVYAGTYASQVERYLAAFPREQVLILTFENLMKDQARGIRTICEHLGVDPGAIVVAGDAHSLAGTGGARIQILNGILFRSGLKTLFGMWAPPALKEFALKLYYRRPPKMSEADRSYLREIFRPDIERLHALTGLDLSAWQQSAGVSADSAGEDETFAEQDA